MLACLLQPWLRAEASSVLVSSFIPDPITLIQSACASALGLPAATVLPVQPPGVQDRPCAHTLTCGHRPSPAACGDDSAVAGGVSSTGADERLLTAAVAHLPLGLQYAADRGTYAAIRMGTGAEATSGDERDHKRVRLQERHSASAADRGGGHTAHAAGAGEGPVAATAVAAVAMAEPGMVEKHAWWRTAAAALAALFTDPEGPCRPVAARCGDGSSSQEGGGGACARASGTGRREHGGRVSSFGRRPGGRSGAGWAGLGSCGHDLVLVLHRVLQVAMVRPHCASSLWQLVVVLPARMVGGAVDKIATKACESQANMHANHTRNLCHARVHRCTGRCTPGK